MCWSDGCADHDVLAAFDAAIADGVDVISISVGMPFARDYFMDSYAIGAFHAMRKGILTSHAVGNEGPKPQTISSVAPWSLSVAATTIDRNFVTMVKLGNRMLFPVSIFSIPLFFLGAYPWPIVCMGSE